MGFENFATNEPTEQEEAKLSEFEINVRRMGALLAANNGDAFAATKAVIAWLDEAKSRYDGKS